MTTAVSRVNGALESVMECAPSNTLLVFVGVGDMRPAVQLYAERAQARRTGAWTLEKQVELHHAVLQARTGLAFIHCKE
jgi:hypothetical protein